MNLKLKQRKEQKMNKIKIEEVNKFVEENIELFHLKRLGNLGNTNLKTLLKKKNPYLFKAKNIITAQELIESFLNAKLSSSEEKTFGDFLEDLAIYVANKTLNAEKSGQPGLDFEYTKEKIRYLVTVKSGLNWGNSSQWKALHDDFKRALRVLRQSVHIESVKTILGICYGNARTSLRRGIILQVTGQNFWYMISGEDLFYQKIIEPLGYRAKELNEEFDSKKSRIINRFTGEFIKDFCKENGEILWDKLVEFNSSNLTAKDREEFK